VSNQDSHPDEVVCRQGDGKSIEILTPREVPLGGLRAKKVRRTLPQRDRSFIGAWCFADHYGPDDIEHGNAMTLGQHPHTGLQTVSWLFSGRINHADSAGFTQTVLPGQVNLMTAGKGISHSEFSDTSYGDYTLWGAQLWVALPDHARFVEPGLVHHVPEAVSGDGWEARVFIGSLLGSTSPVPTHSPLLGAELVLQPGARMEFEVDSEFEHGVLVDHGVVEVDGCEVKAAEMGFVPTGRSSMSITSGEGARMLILGGTPFGESIVMWWNFVGRTHDEIVAFREEWQAQITEGDHLVAESRLMAPGRFGVVPTATEEPIPAPQMPKNVRLKERR
jgi:redox-sensitive bicupin YhaK (pirin superfamily)